MHSKLTRILSVVTLFFSLIPISSFAATTADEYYRQGCEYYEQQKFDEAAKAFEKAVELKPENATYHYNLGTIYCNLEKYKEALEHLEKAVKLAPESQAGKLAKEQIAEIKNYLEKSVPAEKLVKEKEPLKIKAEEKVKFSGEKIKQEVKSLEKSAQSEVDLSKKPLMLLRKDSKTYDEDGIPFNCDKYVEFCLQEIYGPLIKKIEKQCLVEGDTAVGKDCICTDFLDNLEKVKNSPIRGYIMVPKSSYGPKRATYYLNLGYYSEGSLSIIRITKFIGENKYVAEDNGTKFVLEVAGKKKLLSNLSQLDNILESARNDCTTKVRYDSEILNKFIKLKEGTLALKNRQFIKKYLTENKKIEEINENDLEKLLREKVSEKVKIHFNVIGTKDSRYTFIFGYAEKSIGAEELIMEGLDLTVAGILKMLQKDKFEIAVGETTDKGFSIIFKKEPLELTELYVNKHREDNLWWEGWGLKKVVEEEKLYTKSFWWSYQSHPNFRSEILVITEIEK